MRISNRKYLFIIGILFLWYGYEILTNKYYPMYFINKESGNFESIFIIAVGCFFIVWSFFAKK